MFNDEFGCRSIFEIEIQPDGVLSVNINNEAGWIVPNELRALLIKGCVDAVGSENPELYSPLRQAVESLESSITLEDLVMCDDDDFYC